MSTQGLDVAKNSEGAPMEEEIPSMDANPSGATSSGVNPQEDDDDIPDMADFETDDATMEVDEVTLRHF